MYVSDYLGNDLSNILLDDSDGITESFLGIGKRNMQKKADKKIAKANKQLAKGHIKAAERKLGKGQKILSNIQEQQQGILSAQQQQRDINATKQVLNAANTLQTESGGTAPGQIGTEAGSITTPASMSSSGVGGGAGGMDTNDMLNTTGDFAVDENGNITDQQLPGVTVTAKKKPNWIAIAIVAAVILIVAFVIIKYSKNKN